MRKLISNLFIVTAIVATLIGCSKEIPEKFDLKQLTRVDAQYQTNEDDGVDEIIVEEDKINTLREIFAKIDWEQNIKAEMSRKEDVKATLFFTYDKNEPERLFEYLIWFNQSDETATIIDKEKNALGNLDKENTKILKGILMNN